MYQKTHKLIGIISIVVLTGLTVFFVLNKNEDTGFLNENSSQEIISEINNETTSSIINELPEEKKGLLERIFTSNYEKIDYDVPFTSQAPLAQWEDPLYQDACEEASILMAMAWVFDTGKLSKQEATDKIFAIAEFEKNTWGWYRDTSASDTVKFAKAYFAYDQIELVQDITIENIKEVLRNNGVVVVPADGIKLKNPYFSPPGPPNHMLLIRGFDDKKQEFITNDPGTRRGEEFRYDYKKLYAAIGDYATGYHEGEIQERAKVMIAIYK